MARHTSANYTGITYTAPITNMTWADAGTDAFQIGDIQSLGMAIEQHTHDGAGKGLTAASVTLAAITAALGAAAVDLASVQTITGQKTMNALVLGAGGNVAGELGYAGAHALLGDGAAQHTLVDLDSAQAITGLKTITAPTLLSVGGSGGAPAAVNGQPCYRGYYNGANYTMATATWVAVGMNTELYKQNITHNAGGNGTTMTPTVAGVYEVQGFIEFLQNNVGTRGIKIRINGARDIAMILVPAISSAFNQDLSISAAFYFNGSTDYAEVYTFQDSGTSAGMGIGSNGSPGGGDYRCAGAAMSYIANNVA